MEAIEYLTSRVISTEDSDYKGKLALQLNEAYRLFYCKVNTKFRLLYKHITPEIKEEYEKYAAKTKEVDNPNLYSKEAADQVFTFLTRLIMYVDNPLNHYRGIRNGL